MRPGYDKLDQVLQKNFGGKFGFSVLIADDVKVLFNNAYGYSDVQKTKRVNKKTLFNIASISKSFTATGIMRLLEQNKIKLSDTLGQFFDNVPADKSSITIGHLLSHQSGFQQNYVCDGLENSHEALKSLLMDTLGFAPGTSFGYSNQNYEMLAIIMEKSTSMTYENFVRREILKPLKLKDTYFWNEVRNCKNIASKNKNIADNLTGRNWGYIGSGGLYSTAYDLYQFIKALLHNQLIAKKSTDLLFGTHCKTSDGLGIGYGWFINNSSDWDSKEIWTRGSEDWGHNAVIRWFPDKKTIIVVCTNSGEMGDKQATGNRIISSCIADFLWKEQNPGS